MKKLATIILAAIMTMLTAVSSFAAEDPAALLERVSQKANDLDSIDCDLGVHAVLIMDDSTYNLNMELKLDMAMKLKMDQIKSGNLRYKAEMAMEFLGESQYGTVFYKDGYYYMDMDGDKIKYPMDLDSMLEQIEQTAGAADLSPSLMKSISVREEGENRILSYEADPAKMNAYVQETLESLLGTYGADMIIREVKGEYVVNKDDYYTDLEMYMVMDMTMDSTTVRMILLMEGTINNPGDTITFDLPSTEGYRDIYSYYYNNSYSGNSGATGPAAEAVTVY